jgi:hypothetical protein
LALAASGLLPCSAFLFNCGPLDVGVGPCIQLFAVEPNAALADGEFADVGPNRLVELITAHAKVGRGIAGPDKSRGNSLPPRPTDRLRQFCAH